MPTQTNIFIKFIYNLPYVPSRTSGGHKNDTKVREEPLTPSERADCQNDNGSDKAKSTGLLSYERRGNQSDVQRVYA